MRPGDLAVEREVVDGFVWSAKPVRVVSVEPLIGLYRAVGTVCFWPEHPRGEHRPPHTVVQRAEPWGERRFGGLLTLVQPDDDISVSLMWDPGWSLICWYVDFIEPYARTSLGWDFRDLHLDLIVLPDRSSYVKDEDELSLAVERGEISPTVAAAAHARLAVVADAAARSVGIFGADWPAWRPDPSWAQPFLTPAAAAKLQASATPLHHEPARRWWIGA